MERSDSFLITDIVAGCNRIIAKTENMSLTEFELDDDVQDIVFRQFGKIGEAANDLSDEFRHRYRHIKWHDIISLRNRIVHQYADINLERIWKIVREEVPNLLRQLEKL